MADSGTEEGSTHRREGKPPLVVWCLLRDQVGHVEPVERCAGDSARFVYDEAWSPDAMVAARPDLVLCVNDWPGEVARCLDAARRARIPSLVLQDGILEWRCQYENPLFAAGGGAPQHQPVLADKIACIGPSSARHIAAWGNDARVEITGMPRLDSIASRSRASRRAPARRILVMTAKKAGFTPEQIAVTLSSLRDVKAQLDRLRDVEVRWRVSREVAVQLGIVNELHVASAGELAGMVEWADAVVTTPSTALLETMLLDRPVACLDYHNVPRFVPSAWTIGAPTHVAPIIDELLHPTAAKLAFQQQCLEDALACRGHAAARTVELIERLVDWARAHAPDTAAPWQPPAGLLAPPGGEVHPELPLAELYPEHAVFATSDLTELQVRVARLEHDNERLRRQLQREGLLGRLYAFGRALSRRIIGGAA